VLIITDCEIMLVLFFTQSELEAIDALINDLARLQGKEVLKLCISVYSCDLG
jgi:hypothetical protein